MSWLLRRLGRESIVQTVRERQRWDVVKAEEVGGRGKWALPRSLGRFTIPVGRVVGPHASSDKVVSVAFRLLEACCGIRLGAHLKSVVSPFGIGVTHE